MEELISLWLFAIIYILLTPVIVMALLLFSFTLGYVFDCISFEMYKLFKRMR